MNMQTTIAHACYSGIPLNIKILYHELPNFSLNVRTNFLLISINNLICFFSSVFFCCQRVLVNEDFNGCINHSPFIFSCGTIADGLIQCGNYAATGGLSEEVFFLFPVAAASEMRKQQAPAARRYRVLSDGPTLAAQRANYSGAMEGNGDTRPDSWNCG